jgi:hypothetical protein
MELYHFNQRLSKQVYNSTILLKLNPWFSTFSWILKPYRLDFSRFLAWFKTPKRFKVKLVINHKRTKKNEGERIRDWNTYQKEKNDLRFGYVSFYTYLFS